MNRGIYTSFLLMTLLGGRSLFAQPLAQSIIPRFETIGVNEGLSQSSVTSILQDRIGFVWLGTADGLNRFDGRQLRSYRIRNDSASGKRSNFVRTGLCEAGDGSIWFANETGIYYFEPSSEEIRVAYTFDKAQYRWSIFHALTIDSLSNLWLINPVMGIARFSITTRQFEMIPFSFRFATQYVSGFSVVAGSIWYTVFDEPGVNCFDLHTKKFSVRWTNLMGLRRLTGGGPTRIVYFRNDRTLYSYDVRVNHLDSLTVPPTIPIREIVSILADHQRRLWMTTLNDGLICYDSRSREAIFFRHDNTRALSLPTNLLVALLIDRNENLWIGTDGGGVSRLSLRAPKFRLFPLNDGDYPFLKSYFIKCFLEVGGKIWFGTHASGLNSFDPATAEVRNFASDDPRSEVVGALFKDKAGNFWVSKNKGIFLFMPATGKFLHMPLDYPAPSEQLGYRFLQRANGEIMLAGSAGLVTITNRGGSYRCQHNEQLFARYSMRDVIEMRDGTLWYTAPVQGLYHIKGEDNQFELIEQYFSGIDLLALHRDKTNDSLLWIGSGIGLIKLNVVTKESRVYNEKDGLANSYVYGILQDSVGTFWLSSNGGLSSLNVMSGAVQNFTVNDGLQSNEFNTGAFYESPSGIFYFGGIKGFNWFKPSQLSRLTSKPTVVITEINIQDQPFQKDSVFLKHNLLRLPYDQNHISFQFAALDFTWPQANKVEYRLDDWDDDWIPAPERGARYANLPPGHYTLRVKSSNVDGVWSDETRLGLVIEPPFWRQPWFYVVVMLVFVSAVVFATFRVSRARIQRQIDLLERQQAIDVERMKISKDMHDELGAGLTNIALSMELLRMKAGQGNTEQLQEKMGSLSSKSRDLIGKLSEIVWTLNPSQDNLSSFLHYVRNYGSDYFEESETRFVCLFEEPAEDVSLSPEARKNLFLVIKEALNNTLKYARAKDVSVKVDIKERHLSVSIIDNGIGFDLHSNGKAFGNGLRNMQDRVEFLKGTFRITSTPGSGTAIRIEGIVF